MTQTNITDKFLSVGNRHAPLKKENVKCNQAPFLTKELRKEIYTRSKLKNKYRSNLIEENKAIYKKQRNKYVSSLRRKAIKVYFNNVTKTGVQTNKDFWKSIKPYLTNKGFLENVEIMLTEKNKIVTEEKEPVIIFNYHYINIVERSCGTKPTNVAKEQEIEDNKKAVEVICKSFANHESIKAIKENNIAKNLTAGNSHHPKVSACDVEQLLRNIDRKKSIGIDKIPPKLIKLEKS